MQIEQEGRWTNGLFAVPVIAALIFFLLLLSHRWIPTHDTLGEVIWYQQILSHLVDSGSVPVWYAGLNWGHPLNFLIFVQNTPSLFLVAPLAYLFPSLNSVTLFYVAMFINELVLLGGLFALGSRIFQSRWSAFFVAVTFSATVGWATQCWWNFNLYYALPFAFYFIHCGTYDKKPWKIALGFSIATLTGLLGSLLYLAPVQGLMCLGYLGFCLKDSQFSRADLHFKKPEFLALGLLLITLAVPVSILVGGDETQFWIPKRDVSGKSGYLDFLQYGNDLKLHSIQGLVDPLELGFNPGFRNDEKGTYLGDNSTYAGAFLIPLLLLCLLFSRQRARIPFLFLAGVVFLLYLNRSSFLAPLFFEIPGLNLFRHFGLLTPLLRFFLILLAGFGFDELVLRLDKTRDRGVIVTWLSGLMIAAVFSFCFYRSHDLSLVPQALQRYFLQLMVIIAGGLWVIRRALHQNSSAGMLFLVGLALIDGYSYRSALYHQSLHPVSAEAWKSFEITKPAFVPSRTLMPLQKLEYQAWYSGILEGSGTVYAVSIPFLNLETCVRWLRTDFIAPASAELIRTLSTGVPMAPHTARLIGCESPKTMIYDGITLVDSDEALLAKATSGDSTSAGLWVTEKEWNRVFEDGGSAQKVSEVKNGTVSVESYHWNHLTFRSEVPLSGETHWFTLAESWSPQWKALVNGKPVPLLNVNGGFRAVPIPSGPARVEFIYDSRHLDALYLFLWALIAGFFLSGLFWGARLSAQTLPALHKNKLKTSLA